MDDFIELKLIGITYNQIESGVYALILEDPLMGRRLAIVIGYPEAQSIECRLQKVKTPRPLAHDLLASLLETLNAHLLRVDIHKLPSGPYAGKLTIQDSSGEIFFVDARSSDAIALAIRVNAPIFASRQLLEKEGYTPKKNQIKSPGVVKVKKSEDDLFSKYSDSQLEKMLIDFVEAENYEGASAIKKELSRRKNAR